MNHASPAQLLAASNAELAAEDEFIARHLGIDPAAEAEMLAALKVASVQELIDQTVPSDIRLPAPLALPAACQIGRAHV